MNNGIRLTCVLTASAWILHAEQSCENWLSPYAGADMTGEKVMGLWTFTDLKDASGKGRDAVLHGAVLASDARLGACLESFCGWPVEDKRHAAVVANHSSLSPRGAFTLEMWMYVVNGTGAYFARTLIFSFLAFISFLLLVYTLFFAIPFRETYVTAKMQPEVCSTGVYALSRHPGVLWFMGFYLFLWLAFPNPLLLSGGILFSLLNLFYILLQDRWIFMKTFPGYREYKKSTPFLFPTYQSCRRCIKTLHS